MRILVVLCLVLGSVAQANVASADRGFSYGDIIMFPRVVIDEEDPDRVARCDYLVRGEQSRLWFGYVIEIPPPYQDGTRTFTLTDGLMGLTIGADFDVTFTPELGTCAEPLATGTRFHNEGDEEGVVPAGTRYAIFTMRSTDTPGATFFIQIPGND